MAKGSGLFKPQPRRGGSPQDISFFRKRQQAVGFDFQNVQWELLLQLLAICIRENIGVGFYSASGGRGVCFKLYTGGKIPETEYANTAEELNEIIDGVLENMGYLSEEASRGDAAD